MRKGILTIISMFLCVIAFGQERTINGTVTDSIEGSPLPGVNIYVEGTTIGTTSDMDGKYEIEVPENQNVLVFSFVGYQEKNVNISGRTEVNVSLQPRVEAMEEVVVVGYGTQKKSLVTGSISKISGNDLVEGKETRLEQSLQGKTAGVTVMENSGQPGSNVTVRIRGVGTNGDPTPLYVVDGLPMSSNAIATLNPSDIESVEVLKDAASSAIYGSRGANGVVLITTKGGEREEDFTVSYEGYYGVQNPWRKMDVLNKEEYGTLVRESYFNAGQTPKITQPMLDTLGAGTDWQDKMFYYNAPKQKHNLSFQGGSENTSYYSSISVLQHDGIMAQGHSRYDRMNYRLNVDRDFGDRLTLSSKMNFVHTSQEGVAANDHYAATGIIQALNTPPILPVKWDNGDWATPEDLGIGMQEITNPLAMLSYDNQLTTTNEAMGNIQLEYDITDHLTFRTQNSAKYSYVTYRNYTPEYNLDATHISQNDGVIHNEDKYIRYNSDNTLTYSNEFGVHSLEATAGFVLYRDWFTTLGASRNSVIFDDFEHAYIDNATSTEPSAYGTYVDHRMASYLGRVSYNYGEKYMFQGILRVDGSSRFGPENQYGYFPSVSVGWNMHQEEFLKDNDLISRLKLRGSWGQNGNESIGNFAYTSRINTGYQYYYGLGSTESQYTGAQPAEIANPGLVWETSEQINAGADVGMFDNRLTIGLEWYKKNTKDWLVRAPVPLMVGNVAPIINGGEIANSGVELEMGYKNSFGDLNFNARLTGSYNKNEVIDIENTEKELTGAAGNHTHADITHAEPGKPLAYFYGLKIDKIFQNWSEVNSYTDGEGSLVQPDAQPGDFKWVDKNGDGVINDQDKFDLGNPYPDFTGGLNLSLEYKGVDFTMFWYSAVGHQIWRATRRFDMVTSNYPSQAVNRWTGEGSVEWSDDEVVYPRLTTNDANQNFGRESEFWVRDADYLRLKNLTVGYTFPDRLLNTLSLSNLRVYVTAKNVFTFTKYAGMEPEIGQGGGGPLDIGIDHGVYPQARVFMAGVNVSF